MSLTRHLVCARCGTHFDCGSEAGSCWCAQEDFRLPLPPAGSGEDCLCPICLRAAAKARPESAARP